MNSLLGLLIEEITVAIECIDPTIEVIKLQKDKNYPEYKSLTSDEKDIVKKFAKVREKADRMMLKMIHLESAVQLVFYLILLLVNLNEVPLMELNYNEPTPNWASTKWVLGLILFLLKTLRERLEKEAFCSGGETQDAAFST